MGDNIVTTPIIVPTNFVGCCAGDIAAVPGTLTHQAVRSWDYKGTQGANKESIMTYINPSSGSYTWTTFDQLFSNATTKDIIFVLGNPADYLVSGAAVGGAYRGTKGNMCPSDLTAWATAVTAVVSRAKDTWGRTGLKWELWNEIDQTSCYNDTQSLLGPYAKATYQAIKAVDPTAIVLSPSIAGGGITPLTKLVNFVNFSDGASGYARQWIDGVVFHYYNQTASQISQNEHAISYVNAFRNVQGYMKENGVDLPIWVTETGQPTTDTTRWRAYQRRLLTFAALGAKCAILYNYDSSAYTVSTFESQVNEVAALLANNAVITRCEVGMGKIVITINGVTHTY